MIRPWVDVGSVGSLTLARLERHFGAEGKTANDSFAIVAYNNVREEPVGIPCFFKIMHSN